MDEHREKAMEQATEKKHKEAPGWSLLLYWLLALLMPVVFFSLSGFVFLVYIAPWAYGIYLLVAWGLSRHFRKGVVYLLDRRGSGIKRLGVLLLLTVPFLVGYLFNIGSYWERRPVRLDEAAARQLYQDNKALLHRVNDEIMQGDWNGITFYHISYSEEKGVTCYIKREVGRDLLDRPLNEVSQLSGEQKELVETLMREMTPRRMSSALFADRMNIYGPNNIQAAYIKGENGWGLIHLKDQGRRPPNQAPPLIDEAAALPLEDATE